MVTSPATALYAEAIPVTVFSPRVTMASRRGEPDRGDGQPASDEAIYESLYGAIVEQRLPPETKLGEDFLGRLFGVSRTGIRRVLARLAYEKMVVLRRNRGAFVSHPSIGEARDVFAARGIIEAVTTAVAARRLRGSMLGSLRRHVAAERRAHDRGDRPAAIKLSAEFHLRLAAGAGNAVLVEILRELVSRTSLIIGVYGTAGVVECSFPEHLELLGHIAGRRAPRAVAAMRRHLRGLEAGLDWSVRDHRVDLKTVLSAAAGRPTSAASRPRR